MPALAVSEDYAVSFLGLCYDAGMSKEASFILLQKASFNHRCVTSPAYCAGVEEMCKAADDADYSPLIGAGLGMGAAGAYYARAPLGAATRYAANTMLGGTSLLGQGIHGVGKGVGWLGNHTVVPAVETAWRLAKHAPAPLKATALLGALGLGAGAALKNDHTNQSWVNGLPSGNAGQGYNAEDALKAQQGSINNATAGIAALNSSSYPKELQLQKLQQAVAHGAPGSADALPQIHQLEQELKLSHDQRSGIQHGISSDLANLATHRDKVNAQYGEEGRRSGSMWTGLKRWLGYHHLPGGMDTNGSDYYGDRQRQLQMESMRTGDKMDASGEAMRRLDTMYGGPSAPAPQMAGQPNSNNLFR